MPVSPKGGPVAAIAYPLSWDEPIAPPRAPLSLVVAEPTVAVGTTVQPGRAVSPRVAHRRGLVALAALVAAMVCVGLVLRGALVGSGGGPLTTTGSGGVVPIEAAATHVHIVQPGESIWSIVRSSGVRGDPRPIVDRLESQVGHRPLQVGERLVLP
jgi:hypothetical protein